MVRWIYNEPAARTLVKECGGMMRIGKISVRIRFYPDIYPRDR